MQIYMHLETTQKKSPEILNPPSRQTAARCRDCHCEKLPSFLIPPLPFLFILLPPSPLVPQFTPVHTLPLSFQSSPHPHLSGPHFLVLTIPSIFAAFFHLSCRHATVWCISLTLFQDTFTHNYLGIEILIHTHTNLTPTFFFQQVNTHTFLHAHTHTGSHTHINTSREMGERGQRVTQQINNTSLSMLKGVLKAGPRHHCLLAC